MATDNPFLQSPLAALTGQTEDDTNRLIGQQRQQAAAEMAQMQDAPAPEEPAAPVAKKLKTSSTSASKGSDDILPPADLRPKFEAAAQKYDVPANVIMALAHQESRYRADAVGVETKWGKAKGMMQNLDSTAKGLKIDPMDAEQSIDAAAKQIRERLDKGMTMVDAIKEHFAGPDRKLWGEKTEAYGREVMDTVGKIGTLLINGEGKTAEVAEDKPVPKGWVKMTPEQVAAYEAKQSNHFSDAMPRAQYEATFKANNPNASPAALEQAMGQYDAQATKRLNQKATSVDDKFAMAASPEAVFNEKLNKRLAGKAKGVVPGLPGKLAPLQELSYDGHKAERESQLEAIGSQLGKSLKAGGYDLLGAGATVLDTIQPFTLSPGDAAILFKDKPEDLKRFQDESVAMVLSRFAKRMSKNSEDTMQEVSDRAKRDYGDLKYATTDMDKAAYTSPTKVVGDVLKSLPSTLAMALSVYLTKGAAAQAERSALAAGLTPEMARQAAVAAGARSMATVGAASEGTVGYGQQLNQTTSQLEKLSMAEIAKSPRYQTLINDGYTPETARARMIADAAEQSGQIAGIVDAAVNRVGGEFLGKIMTEGGKFLPRVLKGAANESATEFVQSAGEQAGENLAVQQNINSKQELSQGVGEAALAGAVVGGVMGGATAGVFGRGADPETPAPTAPPVQDQQQVTPDAAPAEDMQQALPSAPAPAPSQAGGPLTRASENASVQGSQQDQRVTVATPAGNVGGTMQGYQEDADGNFTAEIVDDDGEVHRVSSLDGVQIVPEAPAPSGPLSASLNNAAEDHHQNPASAPEMPAPPAEPPGPPDYNAMPIEQLRERMKYITQQAKASGGMNKVMTTDKRAVEKAINAKIKEAKEATVLSEEPLTSGPFDERVPANKMALRMAEKTGQPHEVVESKGKFTVQPIQEASDATADTNGNAESVDVGGRSDRVPAGGEPAVGSGTVSDGSVPGGRGNERADAGAGSAGDAEADAGADAAADAKPALKGKKDEHEKKQFSSSEKALAYITKNKLRAKYRIEQTGSVRYELRLKDAAPKVDARAAAAEREAKIEAQISTAEANAAARAGAPAPANKDEQDRASAQALFDEVGEEMIDGMQDRYLGKDLRKELARMIKVQPRKFIKMAEQHKAVNDRAKAALKSSDPAPENVAPAAGKVPDLAPAETPVFRGIKGKWDENARSEIEWWAPDSSGAEVYAKDGEVVTSKVDQGKYLEIDEGKYNTEALNAAYTRSDLDGVVVMRDGKPIIYASFNKPNTSKAEKPAGKPKTKPKTGKAAAAPVPAAAPVDEVPATEEAAQDEDVDTGADIPKAFYKKVKVPIDVYIEEERITESVEMSADKALASVREDIVNLRKLIACMKG